MHEIKMWVKKMNHDRTKGNDCYMRESMMKHIYVYTLHDPGGFHRVCFVCTFFFIFGGGGWGGFLVYCFKIM